MQEVNVQAHIPHACADEVFAVISDFSNYVELCESVRNISINKVSDQVSFTSWEVNFHSGILKWQERDTFNADTREIHFEQMAGDVDHFSGTYIDHCAKGAPRKPPSEADARAARRKADAAMELLRDSTPEM